MTKRVLLCIMDGWGISEDKEHNAIYSAKTPNFDNLWKNMSKTAIRADGENVGLPEGQMGNSEVGHLNIGAGRIVYQDLTRINLAIKDKSLFENKVLMSAINNAKENNSALHLMGLVSDGGVHSTYQHLQALIEMAYQNGLKKVYVHAFLDGRDTPPSSAVEYTDIIEDTLKKYNMPKIASVIGRYYVMDRDKRWDRVEEAYNCLVLGEGNKANSAHEGIEESYKNDVTDEFVKPIKVSDATINDKDSVIFFNFRPDRAREITAAIALDNFTGFNRKKVLKDIVFVCMKQYDETYPLPVAFEPENLKNILGDVLDNHGIRQFRTAETEKYAHITFFFNGGSEVAGKLEERALVASPKVATYDLQPEMSAPQVCENVLNAIKKPEYGFILVNFANPDMVGHTGVFEAAVKAVETVDNCIGKIADEALKNDVVMLLTADHGNAEKMYDETTNGPHTAHTTNPVPFIVIDNKKYKLKTGGALCDIAPTVLQIMGIKKPDEMTGKGMIEE